MHLSWLMPLGSGGNTLPNTAIPAHSHVPGERIAAAFTDHRINQHVINRCRKPSDADILVPGDTISLIGTTSLRIDYNEIDDNRVTAEAVDILLREGEKLAPVIRNAHFAG